jgi:hypothetical protein
MSRFLKIDRYDYYNSDIFATNVMAKDPYTGRQVPLIDSRGYGNNRSIFHVNLNHMAK